MPTYTYRCTVCKADEDHIRSISDYVDNPLPFFHCGQQMERVITVAPGFSGINNALAGDRHYDGLRAPDGTDISSRSKHREYMRSRGLTTVDDFKGTWAKAESERKELRQGMDRTRRGDIAEAITRVEQGFKPTIQQET